MLHHPTYDRLLELGLQGAAAAFADLIADPAAAELDHATWLGLLLDRETSRRMDRRLQTRLRFARLRHPQACPEDIDYRAPRGLDRALIVALSGPGWIKNARATLITGPTGVGKSWIACALGHKACRNDFSVIYHRCARLFEELALAHGDGRHARMLKSLAKTRLLILDDFGLAPLSVQARHDLFEILEDRHGRTATIVVSQLPVERWHEMLGDPTIADAILDRLVHNAYRLDLKGESMRKLMAPKEANSSETVAPVGPQGILPRGTPPAP
jgi:DNA replication protein DnaC